jgi:hypothetical protein
MPRARQCLIDIELANTLRALVDAMGLAVPRGDLGFRCVQCGMPVKPHAGSSRHDAHFEHLKRNPRCSLSDKRFNLSPPG